MRARVGTVIVGINFQSSKLKALAQLITELNLDCALLQT